VPTNRRTPRLEMVCVVVALALTGGAIGFANEEEETLAGDPTKVVQESGCPADYPIPVVINEKEGSPVDENGDGIICTDGMKQFVDNLLAHENDGKLMVTGHGNFFDLGKKIVQDISFSFHGIERGQNGSAKGVFEYHDQTGSGPDLTVHGDVLCLAVDANVATLVGRVTRSNDLGLPVDRLVVWRAEDNGEGNLAVPDRVSRLTVIGGTKVTCKERFKLDSPRDTVSGNIQVH